MGGVDNGGTGGYFIDGVDENDALVDESVDDVLVVDDFVVDVDGRALELKDAVDAFDGHVDAGTETAGVGEKDFHRLRRLR